MTGALLCRSAHQAVKGTARGVLLCSSACQAHRAPPHPRNQLGSFSVDQRVRHIEGPPACGPALVQCGRRSVGQSLYCSAADAGVSGAGREAMEMAPPATRDSAVSPCFRGCLALLHRHLPPPSPPSHPPHPSLHSQRQPPPWDCSTMPQLQLPGTGPPGDPRSCPAYVWLLQGLSASHSI